MKTSITENYVLTASRTELESIAFNALEQKVYTIENILGSRVAVISTTADRVTVEKVYLNLVNTSGGTLEALLEELNDLGYFSEYITIDNIKLNIV